MARIREIEHRALLRTPSRQAVAVVSEAVDRLEALTPELMRHLKSNAGDLRKVRWEVFEHIVGEFLAFSGFRDIQLVGRDQSTSADIAALYVVPKLGTKIRYFIEVKQWRNRVGVRVIDEILGAARTLLFVRLVLKPLDWRPYLPRLKL